MTIADRFAAALAAAGTPGLQGPELLPVRLARACAQVLAVDAVGLTLADPAGQSVPLGASRPDAGTAERLQFTAGAGPCIAAQEFHQPVFALQADLRERWPVFAEMLFAATSFRGVVALPLRPALAGPGAVDLFFTDDRAVPELDVFTAMATGELIAAALSDAAVWSTWSADEGPGWLHGPAPRRRAAVWEAMAKVGLDLDLDPPAALDLMRAAASTAERTVDDLAEDLLGGRIAPRALGLSG